MGTVAEPLRDDLTGVYRRRESRQTLGRSFGSNDLQFRLLAFIGCLTLGGLIGALATHNPGATTALVWIIGLPLYFFVAKPLLRALDRGEDRLLDWLMGHRARKIGTEVLFGSKKKLLEPCRATTELDRAGVIAAIENVCEALNAEQRRKASASWIGKKLRYSEIEAEQHHDRYLCDTSGAVIHVFLNSGSSTAPHQVGGRHSHIVREWHNHSRKCSFLDLSSITSSPIRTSRMHYALRSDPATGLLMSLVVPGGLDRSDAQAARRTGTSRS